MERRGDVVIVFSAMCVTLLWTVLPKFGDIQPYPLSDQIVDSRSYIWIGTIYAGFLLMTWALFRMSDKLRVFLHAVFILQALQFVEYWINYNEAWTHLGNIPVNIGTLRFPILFFYAIRTFITWKT